MRLKITNKESFEVCMGIFERLKTTQSKYVFLYLQSAPIVIFLKGLYRVTKKISAILVPTVKC